jgi:uncharacterized protein
MGQWTFLELAKRVLEEEKRPLTAQEIWEVAKDKGYDLNVGSVGKTPEKSVGAILYVNIRDKEDSPSPKKTHVRNAFIYVLLARLGAERST